LARECLDYYGNWLHFPRPDGPLAQDEYEMDCVHNAWAIERIYSSEKDNEFKRRNGRFRLWVMSKSPEDEQGVWLCPWLEDEE
jgi:hypothetical protein